MGVLRSAFVSGTITNNPLAVGDVTLNSANLSSLATVTSPDIAKIVLDPLGISGAPEVVYVTAHTAAATSATILRAQEGTTARQMASGTTWVHGPTLGDWGWPTSTTSATAYNPLDSFLSMQFVARAGGGVTYAAATGIANQAYGAEIMPLHTNVTITTMSINISVSSGNIDAGVYTYDGTTFTKIVTLGSTASPGTGAQSLNITDTILYRGTRYFFWFAADNATISVFRMNTLTGSFGPANWGFLKATSFPLPATITSASAASSVPVMIGGVSTGPTV